MINYILERLKEKSTYVGILTLLSAAGVYVAPEVWTGIVAVITSVAGLVLVMVKAKKKE